MEEKTINFNDINYAIYKEGSWKNNYEINQIGTSNEIPVTNSTVHHIKLSMDEIRKSEFNINDTAVNGFVAIAFSMNPKIREMDIKDIISLEEKEFNLITEELDNLTLESDEGSVNLDTEDYLIYKLEKECHVTNSKPANDFTKKHYLEEIKKIEDSLI